MKDNYRDSSVVRESAAGSLEGRRRSILHQHAGGLFGSPDLLPAPGILDISSLQEVQDGHTCGG